MGNKQEEGCECNKAIWKQVRGGVKNAKQAGTTRNYSAGLSGFGSTFDERHEADGFERHLNARGGVGGGGGEEGGGWILKYECTRSFQSALCKSPDACVGLCVVITSIADASLHLLVCVTHAHRPGLVEHG